MDGKELIDLSARVFSLPMVAKHLSYLRPAWFETSMTKELEVRYTLAHLVLKSELKKFHSLCIAPADGGHAYIKGFALANQFYDRSGMRYARDVDVLVHRKDIDGIVRRALSEDYEVLDPLHPPQMLKNQQDIRAALRYQKVINLISPRGSHIEVHWELDKDQGIFDEEQMIADGQEIDLDGFAVRTLRPIDHFIYVAYHCARHNWSSLHWLADLDAMARHPSVPKQELKSRAREMGLEGLIDETLGYLELSSDPDAAQPGGKGERILARAMEILIHGESRAREFANTQVSTAIPFPDLLAPWLRARVRRKRFWGRMQPQIADYHAWPLPDRWQWLYRVTGPAGRMLRKGFH